MKVLDQITDEKERLLRQVNPSYVRAGRPTSKVFEPKPKDDGMLSTGRECRRDAAAAHEFFVRNPKCRSVGVLAITVGDCVSVELKAHDAPLVTPEDPVDDDAHAIVDYRETPAEDIEEKAVILHRAAMAVGYVYQPSAQR